MKELSIEEKVKRYDEILARAKGANLPYYKEDIMSKVKEFVDYLLPELKESEDEKIRKELLSVVNDLVLPDEQQSRFVAWLKRQGEQKSIWHNEDEEPQRGSLILLIMQSGNPIVAKIIEPNHTFNHGERWAYIDDLLEKQDKQKTADKVEQKFKVGDWVVNEFGHLKHITKIKNDCYYAEGECVEWHGTFEYGDTHFRLWTIQDAKPGDVLATEDWVFIFEKMNSNGKTVCYCHYDIELGFRIDTNSYMASGSEIYPATKEQRDLLFQKMHEAGYEWDAEHKQLNKIKDESAWTEEDEKMLNDIIKDLVHPWNEYIPDRIEDEIKWLKRMVRRLV